MATIFRLLRRVGWALLLALLMLLVPLPHDLPVWAPHLQQALAVLVFICLAGKSLYDTFFYDRYWL